ncbi:MAG TPA: MerR family transcriptional regulator [Streptosporangiaceae bacterium]|nr:MerR family transcriptional regulator [Streptosporangiaceae bacterium]
MGGSKDQQPRRTWKVGALAKATGLTVRTLHHDDEIGLLKPSARLAGGRRVYDAEDVARLYRIIRLRQLGFPLAGRTAGDRPASGRRQKLPVTQVSRRGDGRDGDVRR